MRYVLLLLLPVGLTAARADYPTPEQAGFHHCVLIYECPQRGPEQFAPYVACPEGWLFDAFLFCPQVTKSGRRTYEDPTTRQDWLDQLDTWFAPGRDVPALEAAVEAAGARLGPPPPRQVIFSIPFPHPGMKDFGDVTGDGVTEDLSTPEGRRAVADWYVAELKRRVTAGGYRHLELWGLYWMREDIPGQRAILEPYAAAVHAAGLRLLWIPWYRAPGWEGWRDYGIDVAILQPNYAFIEKQVGEPRRNRLAVTSELAREHGMGVEIELPMFLDPPGAPALFRHYLRDGAPDRYGYQAGATAYYLSANWVEKLAASPDPRYRSLYDDLCRYVRNQPIAEPDPDIAWTVAGQPAPWLGDHALTAAQPAPVAEASVPETEYEVLDVFLDEPGENWTGLVIVEGKQQADGAEWEPAGWALRVGPTPTDGHQQVVTAPIPGMWSSLRVRLQGEGAGPAVAELSPRSPLGGSSRQHLAFGARYQVTPSDPARYGDSGGELTDGLVPETGFVSGQSVGWCNEPAGVKFDLGAPTELTGAEVCLEGGSYAGINWPRWALLLVSGQSQPASLLAGLGAPPARLQYFRPEPLIIDRRRSESDLDGRLLFRFGQPVRTRYLTFVFEPQVHLMLTEIRIFSGGRNIAAGRAYDLDPLPTRSREGAYPDDGRLLTDGMVADSLTPRMLVGWHDGKERIVDVDLGRACLIDKVVAWSLTGEKAAIFLPRQVEVFLSHDGVEWREIGDAMPAPTPSEPSTACPFTIQTAGVPARYVRVLVMPQKGWAMLSEIEIGGTPLPQ